MVDPGESTEGAESGSGSEPPPPSSFDGEDFLFHLYRGSELLQDNCVSEAKEELERALAMQPRDVEGQGLLGVVYFRLGLYPRAIQIYEEIIRAYPQEVTPRINLALCYLKTGQALQARDTLEAVVRLVPTHRRAWGYLGLVFERTGDLAKAQACFEKSGQPQMAQRMADMLDGGRAPAEDRPESEAIRRAAADAVQELEDATDEAPFSRAEAAEGDAPSRSGRWRAVEPGDVPLPKTGAGRGRAPTGRFGPAVPPVAVSLPPAAPGVALAQQVVVPEARARQATAGELVEQHRLQLPEKGVVANADGAVVVGFAEAFTARLDALRAVRSGAATLRTERAHRRSRGQDQSEPLGGLGAAMFRFEGQGQLVLRPAAERRLLVLSLGDELVYIREERLIGFESSVSYENGRLSAGAGEQVAMVQLSGAGSVVVEHRTELSALEVSAEAPVLVRVEDVLGWTGRLLPQPARRQDAPGGAHGFANFSGDGTVILDPG